jgi:hypothetical protein
MQNVVPMLDSSSKPSSQEELLWRAVGGFDREGCGAAALKVVAAAKSGIAADFVPEGPDAPPARPSEVNIAPGAPAACAPGVLDSYFEKCVFRFEGPRGVEFAYDPVEARKRRRAGDTLRVVQVCCLPVVYMFGPFLSAPFTFMWSVPGPRERPQCQRCF